MDDFAIKQIAKEKGIDAWSDSLKWKTKVIIERKRKREIERDKEENKNNDRSFADTLIFIKLSFGMDFSTR